MSTEPCASSTALLTIFSDAISSIWVCSRRSSSWIASSTAGSVSERPLVKKPCGHAVVRAVGRGRRRWPSGVFPLRGGVGKLLDAALVAPAEKVRVTRKAVTQALAISTADQARAERDGVGVIMLRARARPTAARRPGRSGRRDCGWRRSRRRCPEPQTVIPRSARPSASASAISAPNRG